MTVASNKAMGITNRGPGGTLSQACRTPPGGGGGEGPDRRRLTDGVRQVKSWVRSHRPRVPPETFPRCSRSKSSAHFSENVLVAGGSRRGSSPVEVREPAYIDMLNWGLHSQLTHT